jgi:hypothetical protein
MNQTEKQILEYFLPEGVLEWFDVVSGEKTEEKIRIFLEEKNIPPVTEKHHGKNVVCAGFSNITVNDFPVRGKKSILVFRRRYWKIEGEEEYLKRDIVLCASGTQLEKEFAGFLKARS